MDGAFRLFLLDLLGPAEYVHYLFDGINSDDSVLGGPFEQELGHPLFDPFDYLGVGIAGRHVLEVCGHGLRGLLFEGECISPDADSFYLFHPLSVSMARTISCQAMSISLSCSGPCVDSSQR